MHLYLKYIQRERERRGEGDSEMIDNFDVEIE